MSDGKKRYLLIDGIRGIAIVNMVLFHFFYDFFVIYGDRSTWYAALPIRLWQQFICWTFILVSGLAWQWGMKGNLRRGILVNLFGLLITLVTYLAVPGEVIWFGILNFIGCAVLLMIPLHRVMKKVPALWGIVISFVLFFLFRHVQQGYLGIGDASLFVLPQGLYNSKILTPFGFPYPGFRSSDYFPILPWMFLYLCGYFFSAIFMEKDRWTEIALHPIPLLSAIGRKSIWIYLIHQPLCMLVCELLF